ncbi:MAG: TPR end-of-group domain-containing protein, partial [Bacteroidota bacterium]
MQQLIAQTTPSRKIDEFLKQKADGFDIAYDKKDVKTYNSLLSEYLVLHENLPANEKKERSYELSNIYYNLSCIYSLLDNKISAINSLKKAIDAGYNNYGHIQLDTDLDNIRKEKEFIVLNNKLKLTGDYLFILKKANKYNLSDSRPLPKFNYQSSDNPNLMALRKGFNLDSIA